MILVETGTNHMKELSRRHFIQAGAMTVAGLALARAEQAESKSRIDIHVHLGKDDKQQFDPASLRSDLDGVVRYLVGEMDQQGIEKSLIVPVDPIMPTEIYLDAAKRAPDRILAACSMIPRAARNPLEQLRQYREQGARALKLQPMQYDPADPIVERLIAEAVRLEMPVLFHFTDLPLSFPTFLEHLAGTFSTGNFVVIHFGGVFGFERVLPLGARLANVYLETSTAFADVVNSPLRERLYFFTRNHLGKLIFGTEHPRDYAKVIAAIDKLTTDAPADTRQKIYRDNARKILKLL